MNQKKLVKITDDDYMGIAKEFNPAGFNAREIVRVAKEAGMKWIIITSKHHEGFAMFKSKHPFNIVDASPFQRDPMKELADACRATGLGFGFYYSHYRNWTAPGAAGGPTTRPEGAAASFETYFKEKSFPQVDEICSNYGIFRLSGSTRRAGSRSKTSRHSPILLERNNPRAVAASICSTSARMAKAAEYIVEAGTWVRQNPTVIYGASPSPWDHAHPWGDVTRTGNTLNLVVLDWPADRKICLPGINGGIASATLRLNDGATNPLPISKSGSWTVVDAGSADVATVSRLVGLIELQFNAHPGIDQTLGIHPNIASSFSCEFATATKAERKRIDWMEKFGEWKFSKQVSNWQPGGVAEWDVDVAKAGDYHVTLTYKGEGRPVWSVTTSEGMKIQNQQTASHVYTSYSMGILSFSKPGKHKISVFLVEGDPAKSSLEAIRFSPVR